MTETFHRITTWHILTAIVGAFVVVVAVGAWFYSEAKDYAEIQAESVGVRVEAFRMETDTDFRTIRLELDARFGAVDETFKAFRSEVNTNFKAAGETFEAFRSEVNTKFDAVDTKFEAFRSEVNTRLDTMDSRLDRLEEGVGNLNERFDVIEQLLRDALQ